MFPNMLARRQAAQGTAGSSGQSVAAMLVRPQPLQVQPQLQPLSQSQPPQGQPQPAPQGGPPPPDAAQGQPPQGQPQPGPQHEPRRLPEAVQTSSIQEEPLPLNNQPPQLEGQQPEQLEGQPPQHEDQPPQGEQNQMPPGDDQVAQPELQPLLPPSVVVDPGDGEELCRICHKKPPTTAEGDGSGAQQSEDCQCNRCVCLNLIADHSSEALECGHVASLGNIIN